MSQLTLKGNPIHTSGSLPALHSPAPDFILTTQDLEDRTLKNFKGKRKLIATVPSLDTGVCSTMTHHLNTQAKAHPHLQIIVVSADLPFAQKRFCNQEHIQNVTTLSMMRSKDFGKSYGLLIQDGPLAGILARALIAIDEHDHILYTELVSEITHEPDYHKALKAII